MSWMQPQSNGGGYANGGPSASDRVRRYDFDSSRDNSADERSRSRGPGGYGGFGAGGQSAARVRAPGRLNRGDATRKSRDESTWSKSRSRSRPGGLHGQAGSQVEGQSAGVHRLYTLQLLRPFSQRSCAISNNNGPSWHQSPAYPSRLHSSSTTKAPWV